LLHLFKQKLSAAQFVAESRSTGGSGDILRLTFCHIDDEIICTKVWSFWELNLTYGNIQPGTCGYDNKKKR